MTNYTSVFGNEAIPAAEQSYSSVSLTADQTFAWPELSIGDYLLLELMDVHSSGAYAITLPEANAVSVGRSTTLANRSAYTISVKDNGGSAVTTLQAGETKLIYVTDNSSATGVWGVVFLGTGTSVADASALAGGGLKVVDAKLALNIDTMAQVVSYSVLDTDRAKTIIFTNSGAVNCNLLQASVAGDGFLIGVVNQGTGSVSADPYSGEEVDGELTKEIAPGESAFLVCDGANWFTIGHGRSTQFQFTKLVLDISSGTPFTLTSTQAQNKLIQFIGTATENITVNVPAVVAVYYTQCSYSGAYSLTLKTAAGLGVTLANTDRTIVYCDGTNVVSAQTSAVPATTLAGGVAGAMVYQTAPNATGFTAAGLLSQLLQSGGTGTPTWTSSPTIENLTFSGTGRRITGDFSNATVANRLMFQSSVTNGITALGLIPNGSGVSSAFQAYGNQDPANASVATFGINNLGTDVRVQSGITGTGTYLPMTFYTGGSERMRIDASGNVGIGVTNPAALLDLDLSQVIRGGANGYALFVPKSGTQPFETNYDRFEIRVDPSSQLTTIGNTHGGTGQARALGFLAGGVERMRIDTSGNVGIGTSSPFNSAGYGAITTNGTTGSVYSSQVSGVETARLQSTSGAFNVQAIGASTVLQLSANGSERLRIGTSGQIGIAGANYGTSGQALVSNGSGAAPSWQTISSSLTAASTAEAQAYASDSVALTPLKMKQAMQGPNVSLSTNGYQRLPSGLIIQWGKTASINAATSAAQTFPVSFPSACIGVIPASNYASTNYGYAWSVSTPTVSDFTMFNENTAAAAFYWVAIGY